MPSGFPQSVSVSTISSRAVELSWNPPSEDERNGIITGYLATLTRRDTGSQTQLFSSTTSISFSMLNPFTSYTVTIAASTVVGFGPQSTQFRFTTSEDGMIIKEFFVHRYSCNFTIIFVNSPSWSSHKPTWSGH